MANPNKFTAKEVLNKVLLDSSGNAVTANSVTSQEALNSVLDTTNNRLNMSLAGGTISGDVTIEGDLTVNGSATNSYDEIVNGDLHVKSDAGNSTSAFLVEKNDGTDVFVVDTSNSRVGIGTDDPKEKLHVSTGNNSNSGNITFLIGGTEGNNARTGRIIKNTSSPYEMTIRANDFSGSGDLILNDDGGNIGIGVSPQSGWQSSYTALQLSNSVLYNNGGNDLFLGANFYFDGSNNKYITADGRASAIGLADGALKFFVSSSTTHSADSDVTFNQALTIDTSGNATFSGVTTIQTDTSPAFKVDDANGDTQFQVNVNASDGAEIAVSDGGSTEKVRFSARSGGNSYINTDGSFGFGIGTDSPAELLHLQSAEPVLRFTDSDDSKYHHIFCSSDDFYISADRGTSGTGGNIIFRVGSTSEKMRIDGSGNVGIGTTNPLADFVVSNGGNAGIELQPEITTDTNRITNYDRTANAYMDFRLDALSHNILVSGSSAMFIDSNGKVGIGTESGNAYFSDELVVDVADNGGITIANTDTTHSAYLMFADGTSGDDAYRCQIGYDHNIDRFGIWTAATNALLIDSSQNSTFAGEINTTLDSTSVIGNFHNTNASGYGLKIQATGGTASQYIATFNDKDDNVKARVYGDGRITSFNSSGAVIRLESTNTNITTSELVGKLEAHISDTSGNLPGIAGSIDWTTNGSIDGGSEKGTDFSLKTYIESDGLRNVLVGKANGVIELPIGQLQFPATQNASSDANTLDDYEEGDWTITDESGAGLSLTVLSNKYIKVGRQVTATANVTFPTTSDTNVVQLSLPFTASSTGSVSGGAVLEQNISSSNHYTACVDGANALKFRIRGVTSQTYANVSGKRFKFIITYHTVD